MRLRWPLPVGLAIVIAGILALTALTLSPNTVTEAQESPLPVSVLDFGFVPLEPAPDAATPSDRRRILSAVRVENPNVGLAAEGLRLTVRVLDRDGRRLADARIIVAQLMPAERRNLVATISLGPAASEADAVEAVVIDVLRWR